MGLAINRSEFLHGNISGQNRPVRPPWSLPEMEFRSSCDSCGKCVEKCPTEIIEFGRGQIPLINFDKGECIFCGDCAEACPTTALQLSPDHLPWHLIAVINDNKCLAFQNVECRSCQDPCEIHAIRFLALAGSASKPNLNTEQCNGCGACYSVCPVNAISMNIDKENNNGY